MKKIIWIFGKPGSGRKTLINNIKNDSHDAKKILGIENTKIEIVAYEYQEKGYFDFGQKNKRNEQLINHITEFLNNDNEVLIIKGDFVDMEDKNNGIIGSLSMYPLIEKEIVFLNPNNLEDLYKRLKETSWFKSDEKENSKRFPIEWLTVSVNYMRNQLFEFTKKGYKVYEIDTTNGYALADSEKSKSR